jgi:hypothetical protein
MLLLTWFKGAGVTRTIHMQAGNQDRRQGIKTENRTVFQKMFATAHGYSTGDMKEERSDPVVLVPHFPLAVLTPQNMLGSKIVEELPRNRPLSTATQQQTAVDTWSSLRSAQHP